MNEWREEIPPPHTHKCIAWLFFYKQCPETRTRVKKDHFGQAQNPILCCLTIWKCSNSQQLQPMAASMGKGSRVDNRSICCYVGYLTSTSEDLQISLCGLTQKLQTGSENRHWSRPYSTPPPSWNTHSHSTQNGCISGE